MDVPVLKRMKPTPVAIKAAARVLARGLSDDLAKATPESSVHDARRRIKRLRSLIRLMRAAIGEAAYDHANGLLRETAGLLAGQRRAEALVVAAGKLAGHSGRAGKLVKLTEQNRDEHAAEASTPGQLEAARRFAVAIMTGMNAWKVPRQDEAIIADAFRKTYRRARRELSSAVKSGDVEAFHEARKHVIHHFHHTELLQDAFPDHPARRLARLEALREVLGDLNDLDELEQLAAGKGQPVTGAAAKALHKRRRSLIADAEKAGKSLFRHRPKAFATRSGAMWGKTGARPQS